MQVVLDFDLDTTSQLLCTVGYPVTWRGPTRLEVAARLREFVRKSQAVASPGEEAPRPPPLVPSSATRHEPGRLPDLLPGSTLLMTSSGQPPDQQQCEELLQASYRTLRAAQTRIQELEQLSRKQPLSWAARVALQQAPEEGGASKYNVVAIARLQEPYCVCAGASLVRAWQFSPAFALQVASDRHAAITRCLEATAAAGARAA
jgi:hypothetical protein